MATTAAPYGFRPVGLLGGGTWSDAIRHIKIANDYGTAIFYGDVVKIVNTGTIEKDTGTTTMTPCGIFVGCKYTDPNTNQLTFNQTYPASTAADDIMAYVVDDPNVLFTIQADAAFTNTRDIYGKNTLLVQGSANTTLGISRVALDASEISTDAQNPIRIIDYLGGDQGDEKGSSFPILVCKFNYHQHALATGSA